MKEVSKRIRILREAKGFSQENMAQELGISQQGYSALERKGAGMKLQQLGEIAVVLDVSVGVILSPVPLISDNGDLILDPKVLALKMEVELLRQKIELQEKLQPPPPFDSGTRLSSWI